jgi:hypothetical protein
MDVAHHLLVLLHLVAFAALLGGSLVQLRAREPEVNAAMLHGAWVALVSGAALWALSGTFDVRLSVAAMVVKTVVSAFVTLLVVLNRRFFSIPRGLLRLIVLLVLADAAVAVLW